MAIVRAPVTSCWKFRKRIGFCGRVSRWSIWGLRQVAGRRLPAALSATKEPLSPPLLPPRRHFLIKIFQGEGFDLYHKQVREMFDKVQMRKPLSSRDRSREQYMLGRSFRGG